MKGAFAQELNHLVNKKYKPANIDDSDWYEIIGWLKPVNFNKLDLPNAFVHIKYRDYSVPRRRGIGGVHDLSEWNKLRIVDAVQNPSYNVQAGMLESEVEEVVMLSKTPHPKTPGVLVIEYKIPALDGTKNPATTTGALRGNGSRPFVKTVYDPVIWDDDKLEQALKEAIQDASNRNNGIIPREWVGKSHGGYGFRGYYDNGVITSFFFE